MTRDLGRQLFEEVQRHLAAKGLEVATGTIVDATIISGVCDPSHSPSIATGLKWYGLGRLR